MQSCPKKPSSHTEADFKVVCLSLEPCKKVDRQVTRIQKLNIHIFFNAVSPNYHVSCVIKLK